ncbi:MAG TPA: LuxR C-terminal-related transcriptional regulator [Acidimicrobiales bacterium]|nr:LuxR C-terminal-related transcriptional regulator [Acidimicrobiales bacterium]
MLSSPPSPVTDPLHYVPVLPQPLVRRARLETLLHDENRRQLTLVSGLPGAGKTTLVASWLHAVRRPAAWLGVDARDNEPGRLARSIVGALSRVSPVAEPGHRLRRSDAAVLDRALAALTTGDWVLVLDDVHELRAAEALGTLGHLIDRTPPNLSLVLCTRADPPVALGRLRLEGRLGEIRNADLEFTATEAAELFAAHGIDLGHDDVHALWRRTQGWVAGLRLAAGALGPAADRHELVRSTAATEAAVADYLLEEVLDRQEPGTQSFLLRTSIVDHLSPELAAVLSDDDQAQRRLDDLERSGVFLADVSRIGWYRYHALFAALLRASLRRRHPDLVDELHRRAARWLAASGRAAEAEHHARRAGDWAHAGRLAAHRWLAATLDDLDPAPDPLAGIPTPAIAATPDLALVAAAQACRRGERDAADLHRSRLDTVLGPPDGAGGRLDPRRLLVDIAYGWAFGADDRARRATGLLLTADPGDREHATAVRRVARLRGAGFDVDGGDFDAAVAALRALADTGPGDWIQTEAAALLALLMAAGGNLVPAEQRATAVLASDPAELRPDTLWAVHLALALVTAQRGERRSAAAHLAAADDGLGLAAHPLGTAHAALQAALRPTSPGTGWLDTATASHPLASLTLIAAGTLEIVDPQRRLIAVGGPVERAVVRARQHLARGAPEAARAVLDGCLVAAPPLHVRTAVEASTLAAVASAAIGDGAAAVHLRAALDVVEATGVRAPLLDHAAAVADLLERETEAVEHRALVLDLIDALRRSPGGNPAESLTEREVAVLHYLPTLMSNAEIAAGLHLSINTVKSHLKAVYRKLGVEGRREAVLRGRELELI